MVISNSSSNSITSSTISRESAPTSSMKEVERVTCSLLTPKFSQTISMTRSSTEGTIRSSQSRVDLQAVARDHISCLWLCTTAETHRARFLGIRASQAKGADCRTDTKENDYMV